MDGPGLGSTRSLSTFTRGGGHLCFNAIARNWRQLDGDRSVISLHLPGVWPFGITPILFTCSSGRAICSGKGPSMRWRDSSFSRYWEMISGWRPAEGMFLTLNAGGSSSETNAEAVREPVDDVTGKGLVWVDA